MAKREETEISQFDSDDLLALWMQIRNGKASDEWQAGKAFEYLILRAFELEEADVVWPYSVTLEGFEVEQIDGVVYSHGLVCLIEAKDYTPNVAIAPIAKLRNQLLRRPATVIGVVFSKSGFTENALTLTRYSSPQRILLWEGTDLDFALRNRQMRPGLELKYRHAVEHGLPNFRLKEPL